ncbi:MAG: hypothetical protein PHP50_08025 [Lachnospiraceae bacterium]|nr:hypothetical protein [Lachnospiraceae bacterium]
MKQNWKWLKIFIGIVLAGLIACISVVVYIDPFFQYHAPLSGFPYVVDNQLSQNPGMARNMDYDSVILGSSMTINFNTGWFNQAFDCNTIKLSYNGAYPKDISNIMEQVDGSGHTLKNVFWGIDEASYSGGINETKYPIPEYLYDTNPLNDVGYWINKDVLLDYILKPLVDPASKTDLAEVYANWPYFGYSKWVVMQTYQSPDKPEESMDFDAYLEDITENMDANICPVIEKHPDTEFYIFFPPYSILYWYNYYKTEQISATISKYELLMERFLAYDNVHLFCFTDQEDIITNLENYTDYEHYSRDISLWITDAMETGNCEVTKENYKEILQHMENLAFTYDYDSIWEGWEDYLYEK